MVGIVPVGALGERVVKLSEAALALSAVVVEGAVDQSVDDLLELGISLDRAEGL